MNHLHFPVMASNVFESILCAPVDNLRILLTPYSIDYMFLTISNICVNFTIYRPVSIY